MKATMSKDGLRRVNLNLSFRLDAETMATLITSDDAYLSREDKEAKSPAEFAAEKIKLGERKLFDICRAEIERHGAEVPSYRVGDNDMIDYRDALTAALREKFGLS